MTITTKSTETGTVAPDEEKLFPATAHLHRRSEVHIRTDIRLAVKTHGQVPQGFRRQPVRYKPNEKRTGIEFIFTCIK